MKLIYRIESTPSKVQTKKFPAVSPNPRRLKSLTQRSHTTTLSKPKLKIKDAFRNEEELFTENVKLITSIESTGPKIACWTSKKGRQLTNLLALKKQEQKK